MAISLDAFLYAITSNETGHLKNPYAAKGPVINGDRAYGKYQIMGNNIPYWGRLYLKKNITISQYMASPDLQESLARAVLTSYYNKYGAEGAAAMWFSGQSNPNSSKSDGHWTVKQYVAHMKSAAAGYKGGSSSGGGGVGFIGSAMGFAGDPAIDTAVLAEQYGLVQGLMDSVPELGNLFKQAVAEKWTADKFKARMSNTTWWKTHSEKQRQYLIKSFSDPASFNEDRDNAKFKISELANGLGAWNLIGNQKIMNDMIWGVLYNGWSDAELKYNLANILTFSPEGNLAGAGGEFQNKMASAAWQNGVRLDKSWYMIYWKMIMQGVSTEQQALQDIRNRAAAQFPGLREMIFAGQNVIDIASPYMNTLAQVLELNPSRIDLFDHLIIGALNNKNDNGVSGVKPLWQFENELRKDPRWFQTNNAREGLMAVGHKVAQDFGVAF